MARLTDQVAIYDEFDGTGALGGLWKNNTTNIDKLTGACRKASGTATTRYFTMLPHDKANVILDSIATTSPTTNTTDFGYMWRSLDSTTTRGGQLYLSVRKTATANSLRLLHRTNTSGSDTVLASNTSAGLADNTTYHIVIEQNGTSFEVFFDGVSKLTHTLSGGVDSALTGTDVGITFTNTDAGTRIDDFFVIDETLPIGPVPTNTQIISHRGTVSSDPTTEEQLTGLETLPDTCNGVEIDARLPSDWATTGKVFLCHDETVDRTSPTSATGTVASMTTAQLESAGIEDLETYLEYCAERNFNTILVQHYTANTVAQLQPIVDICQASPVKRRIMIMTSATAGATPAFAEIRGAGWGGKIGCYGLTAANWATHSANMATYNVDCGFTPPGDSEYVTNRSHIATMQGAGYETGGSTLNSTSIDLAIDDEVTYILTDVADEFTGYELPAHPGPDQQQWGVPI